MKTALGIATALIILIIALFTLNWWQHSDRVTFQEYRPTASLGGSTVTSGGIEVKSARAHHGIKLSKSLILNVGTDGTLTESDGSVYSQDPVTCLGVLDNSCHLIKDAHNRPIRISVQRAAINLPSTGQEIHYVLNKTDITIIYSSPSLLSDEEISNFIDSFKPYTYSGIPVTQI